LGDGQEHGDDPAWDAVEAESLYGLLERNVVPEFYTRDDKGIPKKWVKRIRESMAQLTPRFSADRTVREYTEQHYLPAAAAYIKCSANKGAIGKEIIDWRRSLDHGWPALHFGEVNGESRDKQHVFEVQVFFNDLDPKAVLVELYAEGGTSGPSVRKEMQQVRQIVGISNGYVYGTAFCATRPLADYTARAIPHFDGAAIPLEDARILWQR